MRTNPNPLSPTRAVDRPAHVLIATILFIERRRRGGPGNAILREHPRHDREHAPGQAAENHGGGAPPPAPGSPRGGTPREAVTPEPGGERPGRRGEKGPGTTGGEAMSA